VNKLSKLLVKLCFCVWLASSILPGILAEYKPFAILFLAGKYIGYAVMILAVVAFIIPMLPKKKQPVSIGEKTTVILHDIGPETAIKIFGDMPNTKFFCASNKMAACKGFYACWLRTPGICALHDGMQHLGKEIASCGEFIIVSKNLYGGFSKEIKNALDRSISFALPFFQVRNKEQHHQARYANSGKMRVYIYSADEISNTDKNSIGEIAKANAINMNKFGLETHFINNPV
jgi:hypothetical protein